MAKVLLFENPQQAEDLLKINETKTFKYEGKEFCVHRNNQGLYAFEPSCPHMSVSLENAKSNPLNEIVCPLHAYRFRLEDGQCTLGGLRDLELYEVSFEEDGVFVDF